MKVGDLRNYLAELPDDTEIVTCGYFGEGIRMRLPRLRTGVGVCDTTGEWREAREGPQQTVVAFDRVYADPDGNATDERREWYTGEPEKEGFYLARVGYYYRVLHHRGGSRGWTYKTVDGPPEVIAWQHLPDWKKAQVQQNFAEE